MSKLEHQQLSILGRDLHVVTSGDPRGAPHVFLHGWPQSWCAWHDVMRAAGDSARCIAIDLPGIGASHGRVDGGAKHAHAEVVHALITQLAPEGATLIGHDVGGMIAYAYLRTYSDVARVVIVNTVIPGVSPWDDVIHRPEIWHFGFHAVPALPEVLVQGKQLSYFAFFYDVLAADPSKITPDRRAQYASAYGDDDALHAGFELYRALRDDAKVNAAFTAGAPCETPLLYVRGDRDPIEPYVKGFREAGVRDVVSAVIPQAGHFVADENPAALWNAIAADHRAHRAA
jgi:pimeloyl-ACP methyl ester carboxylesterase